MKVSQKEKIYIAMFLIIALVVVGKRDLKSPFNKF